MATSGSTDWTLNRDELIQRSLRLCNIVDANETPSSDQISDASNVLNGMVKGWMADGLNLWCSSPLTLSVSAAKLAPRNDSVPVAPVLLSMVR